MLWMSILVGVVYYFYLKPRAHFWRGILLASHGAHAVCCLPPNQSDWYVVSVAHIMVSIMIWYVLLLYTVVLSGVCWLAYNQSSMITRHRPKALIWINIIPWILASHQLRWPWLAGQADPDLRPASERVEPRNVMVLRLSVTHRRWLHGPSTHMVLDIY